MMVTLYDQTILADPRRGDGHAADGEPGDCYRTCLAIISDTDPATMPNFARFELDMGWWRMARLWAFGIGRDLRYLSAELAASNPDWWPERQLFIGSGPSPRGKFDHCVVVDRDLRTVHDPHPSRAGLIRVEGVEWLLPVSIGVPPYVRALPAGTA